MELNDEVIILLNDKKIGEKLLGKPIRVRGVAMVDISQTDPPMERKAVIQYLVENDYRWTEIYRKE